MANKAHPKASEQAGAVTYESAAMQDFIDAGHFSYNGTLACGTPVTVVHVTRRRYVVFDKHGKALGYVCAADASNVINRVEGNTLATLRLH